MYLRRLGSNDPSFASRSKRQHFQKAKDEEDEGKRKEDEERIRLALNHWRVDFRRAIQRGEHQ